ncbi:MAG TPA: tRNA uridine-5-carboxymethylaminomethyl(34) synthesis GTPase MnmE [bacterium]|nr:tRNA uridine-5-carboxymethylaminomethyl(34) synthesis GTPase MnmE [bacterium]
MKINNDTIVARSTAAGFSALAVIRLSGPKSTDIINKISNIDNNFQHSRAMLTQILSRSQTIDEVMITFFRAPNSYTGEDMIEISCHGSPVIVREIIDLCISKGARMAEPGEFTKRRFLNNKIDLTQAEGINNLIHSQTKAATRSSKALLEGEIGRHLRYIKQQIIDNISLLELELDFTEEEIEHTSPDTIKSNIYKIIDAVSSLIKTYQYGRLIHSGLKIALIGPPNSGKSSLLNAIIKEERAIISSKAGTTRDFIQETIDHNGYKLTFFDTAGIRKPLDSLEHKGIDKSREIINKSDLQLLIIDSSQDHSIYNEFIPERRDNILFIVNKIDIIRNNQIHKFTSKYDIQNHIEVSALQRTNIDILNDKIISWLEDKKPESEDHIITVQRHYNVLKKTKQELQKAIQSIQNGFASEFIVTDLRHALSKLDEILGKTTNDEILNNIFSNFCIGK